MIHIQLFLYVPSSPLPLRIHPSFPSPLSTLPSLHPPPFLYTPLPSMSYNCGVVHLQEHHAIPEYLKNGHGNELIPPSTPRSTNTETGLILGIRCLTSSPMVGEISKPCSAALTKLELGLGFIAVNLCIIALMMGIQISRQNPSESITVGNFFRWITCCCNPLYLSQCLVNICGMNALYSFVGKPNKRDTYTV